MDSDLHRRAMFMAQNMPFAKHIVGLVYINGIFFAHKFILFRFVLNIKSFIGIGVQYMYYWQMYEILTCPGLQITCLKVEFGRT